MAQWTKGQSGNRNGRPRNGTAIAELARAQVQKHKLIEKLGEIGGRLGEYGDIDTDQQIRAIQLLLAYGYGPPRPELEKGDGIVIQVNYVQTNQFAITRAASSATASRTGGETVQPRVLRAPVGEDSVRDGSIDSSGAAR